LALLSVPRVRYIQFFRSCANSFLALLDEAEKHRNNELERVNRRLGRFNV
jgi:hypothetical protein